MDKKQIHPPQWPLKFLRFFLRKDYLEEIEGDMEEIFYDNVEQFSARTARRMYTWEMLKLLRPVLIKNLKSRIHFNQHVMFGNYFKVSLRGLMKTPLNSFINVFGLAMAIGISIFAFAFGQWTYSTDQFHTNKDEVFLITMFSNREGTEREYGRTPRPLGEILKGDFPQLQHVCRVEDRTVVVKVGDQVFNERVRYADPGFLHMFTFPLKWGTRESLNDINSVILNEEMSSKYFGEENPIGQSLLIKFDEEREKIFKVTGVAERFPDAHTIDFNFLVNFENARISEQNYDFHDWKSLVNGTFVQADPLDIQKVKLRMDKYRQTLNAAIDEDWAVTNFGFEPLATLHERSEYIHDDISRSSSGNYSSVIYLGAVSALLLLLACFNYINIAIASAAKRLKEIGVRKSIGASRAVVILQFLSENMLVTFFALIVGFGLGVFVVIPWFEGLWSFSLDFNFGDPRLFVYLTLVMAFTGIASGIYPAFYISHFRVVNILKGSMKFGQRNPMTKTLLCAQLVLTIVFITAAVMFTQNSDYLAHRSWGYNQGETMYAQVPTGQAFEQLNAEMARNKNVVSISGSTHHLGRGHTPALIHFPERDYEVDQYLVGPEYIETMGLQLKEGRTFHKADGSDKRAVVINELLAKNLAWEQPVGQIFEMDSTQYEVIGVVKEFHSYSFFRIEKPALFRLGDRSDYRFVALRVQAGTELETYANLQAQWAKLFPETPFKGGHQEDVWGNYYMQLEIHGHVWRVFATIAVILASLGLYGLVTLNVMGRVREFSIRKVLGAGLKSIAGNITRQYLGLFIVAVLVGSPTSYFLVKILFDSAYEYHMPVGASGVVLALVILIAVVIATLFVQVRKVLKFSPVDGLKTE